MPKPPSSTWTERFWKVDLHALSWHDTPYDAEAAGKGKNATIGVLCPNGLRPFIHDLGNV